LQLKALSVVFCGFSLYVSVAVLRVPQFCLRGTLDFAFTLLFNARCCVGYPFFSTRQT
jgi:hypothetical protein